VRRFFAEGLSADSAEVSLRGDELRHLKVLRLGEGEKVALFNGRGLDCMGVITSVSRASAVVAIESTVASSGESPLNITLLAGLTKAQKPDLIVQKATELGLKSLIFYFAGRSVPEVSEARLNRRLERWRRIALGAVKQCGRSIVPALSCKATLASAIGAANDAGVKLFFYEGGGLPIAEVLAGQEGRAPKGLAILIGPEGGFTEEESLMAQRSGYMACTLGPRILRAETAAIAAVAILQNLLGDI